MTITHERERKCWGFVRHLFTDDHCAISYLELEAGWRSSRHEHAWRANQFSVISGKIAIDEWDVENHHETILSAGQSYSVPSGIQHQFRVLEPGIVIEVYWVDRIGGIVDLNDITRYNEGGKC
jgi:quercetin dioxygenase-like cupin family protein